jgi:hypothetical protein
MLDRSESQKFGGKNPALSEARLLKARGGLTSKRPWPELSILNAAAAALGYPSVQSLHKAIRDFCEG